MRLYVPATIADLLAPAPLRRAASAVTPALRAALSGEDDESLEFSAFLTAADLSALEIGAAGAAPRRVVLAAEVPAARPVSPAPAGLAGLPSVAGVVDIDWSDVVAIHVDDDDDATAALVGRAHAEEEALEALGEVDLLWYDPSELPALQTALREDGGDELAADLALALAVADALDELTMGRFGALDLVVTAKPDASPVSDADTAAERLARDLIGAARPGDSLLGEEFGGEAARTGRQWVIDPIDGTKNFVRGVPVWASLVALVVDGEPVVGVASAPALGRRWYAAQGRGAWAEARVPGTAQAPRRLAVSGVRELADASISYASLEGWRETGRYQAFLNLLANAWRTRGYGDFWSYVLLAEGAVDVAAEPELALHDMAALVPIVREAGGAFTSLDGVPGPWGGNALATNGLLHAAALRELAEPEPGDPAEP